MPFKSEKQRKWMHVNKPEMAKKWEKKDKKMKREQKVRELIKKMVREELNKMNEKKLPLKTATKSHYINLIKKELESKKGQLAYAQDKVNYKGTPDWEKKEFKGVAKDIKKDIKQLNVRVKQIMKMKEGKYVGTETSQAAPPKSSKEKKAVKIYGAYIEYQLDSSNSEYMQKDQRNKLALKMLKDKFKIPSKLKGKLKNKKYHDKYTDYNSMVFEGTCGYGENGELGEEPAGPHLIKKKMKEEVEPIGGMAKIAKIVKDKQHAKVGGQTVDMQSANLLMKLYNAVKDKDKEKMNKMSEKKLIVVLGKLWSRVKLKLPT